MTTRRAVAVLTLSTVLAVASFGCASSGTSGRRTVLPAEDPVREGRDAYAARCASCHGPGGRGDGPVVAALRVPPADLTMLAQQSGGKFPRAHVIDVVTGAAPVVAHGSREMPVWSDRFAFDEHAGATAAASIYARRVVENLATYLESIQRR
jgi:mono/diheme cytochrome c family protein